MKPANYIPPTTVQIGPDLLVIMDGGEEWSLATDEPQYELRKRDWDQFNPTECRPADFQMLMSHLEKSA